MSENGSAHRSGRRTDSAASHCPRHDLGRLAFTGRRPGLLRQRHAILDISLRGIGPDLLVVSIGIQNGFGGSAAGKHETQNTVAS